jgi:glycosyltransferase involved in cell wall biosynthesis
MENVYPAMDVVALTSRNEGTPLTLIEAMANSRPVIATAVGGVVDLLGEPIVSHGSESHDLDPKFVVRERGISVAPDNAEAFAAGLQRLIEDSTLRRETGARGLQFVTTQYSTERLLKDIAQLYAELLSGAHEKSGGKPALRSLN